MKRAIKFTRKDGTSKECIISKVAKIHIPNDDRFYLEQLKDGTFGLAFTSGFANEFSDVTNIDIIRED